MQSLAILRLPREQELDLVRGSRVVIVRLVKKRMAGVYQKLG